MSAPRDATHDDDVEIIGPWRPKPRHAEVVASRASAASSESHTCSSMPRTSSARHATPATGTTSASAAAAASSVSAASAAAASVSVSAASAAPSDLDFGSFRSSDVAVALRDVFGHRTLRAPQARAVSCALRSKDCFVLAPTGGGKSLCYQLPAVLHARQEPGTVTIVVSPLIALMQDQGQSNRREERWSQNECSDEASCGHGQSLTFSSFCFLSGTPPLSWCVRRDARFEHECERQTRHLRRPRSSRQRAGQSPCE